MDPTSSLLQFFKSFINEVEDVGLIGMCCLSLKLRHGGNPTNGEMHSLNGNMASPQHHLKQIKKSG